MYWHLMAEDTPNQGPHTPEVTQTEVTQPESSAALDNSGVGEATGGQPTPNAAPNDQVRFQYWQSEAQKAHSQIKELQEQLNRYIPDDERERFQHRSTVSNLQNQLIETQLASGYWESQFPELKYLSRGRLESVVRNAYQAHPDNQHAIREVIAQTAAGAKEIAESVERTVTPKVAPADAPAQATVTPKPNYDNLSSEEIRRQAKKMPLEDLKKLYHKTRQALS